LRWSRAIRDLLGRVRGKPVDRALRDARTVLRDVDAAEPALRAASDADLRERARTIRERAADGDLPWAEGLALVREAGRRVLGLRLHDSQVLAAVALGRGQVVELATGEGKTLAAVAPAWLASLTGRGVHVLTFNDYLARRDASWMGPLYEFLDASVGCVQEETDRLGRQDAWACDVTYATAKQAGFDYLRDQLALALDARVHRPFHFAIVDEADSLLIDEARVPLVLAGGREPLPLDPRELTALARRLEPGRDFEADAEGRNVGLTEAGAVRAERELGVANLHDAENRDLLTALNVALHAEVLLRRDVDYIVRDGRIEVVDEFTGRVVADRRWPDGLHPALEAKEGLEVRAEGVILASLPLQHFFRLYPRLAGMTATAVPAAEELREFYGLEVAVVPPHRPCIRDDEPDAVFTDAAAKLDAVVDEVRACAATGRPVVVGTASVLESERLAAALRGAGLACNVLNAKNDEAEARVVAEAGCRGAVTISTNMAGRGTDIRLGGSSQNERAAVAARGGLRVVGTNRHESRRVDEQLRGRAGRQGDPGASRLFVSLEDDLVERYGIGEAIAPLLADLAPGRIDSPRLVAEIERAQRIIEGQNFDTRRTLWNYSSLIERQRRMLGELRERALREPGTLDLVPQCCPEHHATFVELLGAEATTAIVQRVTLVEIDRAWSTHLARIADVRENVHLHYIAGFDSFGGMLGLRKTPLDVFNTMAVEAYAATQDDLDASIVRTFEALEPTAEGIDFERAGLLGPTSTWTYLVSDTPFESAIAMLYRGILRRLAR